MKKILFLLISLSALTARAYTTTPSSDLRVWPEIPTIIADGKTVNYIKVYQHDDKDLVYSAFNMELLLPEGFRINQVKDGRRDVNDIKMSDRADATHSISCSLVDGYDLRIIAYSSENANLFQDDLDGNPLDLLFTIGLIAEPTLTNGEHTLQLDGIKFVMKNGDATVPAEEPITFTFTVQSNESAAEFTEDDTPTSIPVYYDLTGRKVDSTNAHGIIISDEGKKIIIK